MENINQVFAENLKENRMRLGLSQLQLGEMLSYSEKSVSKWEAGKAIPGAEVLVRLARIFGTNVDMLLRVADAPFYYLGIDGGATKTDFWLEDENGNIVRTVQAESCNPIDIGIERAQEVLKRGIRETLNGIPTGLVSMFAGISGGTSAGYKEVFHRFFEKFGFLHFDNDSDLETALAAALQGRNGTVAIVGTGSVICNQIGKERKRIGGYGYLFDRGCCGYDLGHAGLQVAFRSLDMPQYRSELAEEIVAKMGGNPAEHLSDFYTKGKKYIASFSICVWDTLLRGDPLAKKIVDESVASLAEQLDVALDAMPEDVEPLVVLVGGQSRYEQIIRPILEREMKHKNCTIEFCKQRPVKGALMLAKGEMK